MSAYLTITGGSLVDSGRAPEADGSRMFVIDNAHHVFLRPDEMRRWRDALDAALGAHVSPWRVVRDGVIVGGDFDKDTAHAVARSLGDVVEETETADGWSLLIDDGSLVDRRVIVRAVA